MVKIILNLIGKALNGKKTWIGSICLILVVLGRMIPATIGLVAYMFPDLGLPAMDINEAIASLREGWAEITLLIGGGAFTGVGLVHKHIKKKNFPSK